MKTTQYVCTTLFCMVAAVSSGLAAAGTTFEQLDANGDGQVSATEAGQDSQLTAVWGSVDSDQNGVINRAEFSAFEIQQGNATPNEASGEEAPGGEM
jgi:hypothetical protein